MGSKFKSFSQSGGSLFYRVDIRQGQREEEPPGRPNTPKHDNEIDPYGHYFNPPLLRFTNPVNFLINTRTPDNRQLLGIITPDYVSEILENGVILNTAGKSIVLYCSTTSALDLWASACVFLLYCRRSCSI
ncbi:hypothetical protein AKJ16_DCAP09450 [Drosera capensis]